MKFPIFKSVKVKFPRFAKVLLLLWFIVILSNIGIENYQRDRLQYLDDHRFDEETLHVTIYTFTFGTYYYILDNTKKQIIDRNEEVTVYGNIIYYDHYDNVPKDWNEYYRRDIYISTTGSSTIERGGIDLIVHQSESFRFTIVKNTRFIIPIYIPEVVTKSIVKVALVSSITITSFGMTEDSKLMLQGIDSAQSLRFNIVYLGGILTLFSVSDVIISNLKLRRQSKKPIDQMDLYPQYD